MGQDSQITETAKQFIGLKGVILFAGNALGNQQPTGLEGIAKALYAAGPGAVMPGVHEPENDQR
jgi:hypothetical protein